MVLFGIHCGQILGTESSGTNIYDCEWRLERAFALQFFAGRDMWP